MKQQLMALLDAMQENDNVTITFSLNGKRNSEGETKNFKHPEEKEPAKTPSAEKPEKKPSVKKDEGVPTPPELQNPQVFLDRANDLFKGGDFDKAIEVLVKGQLKHPKDKAIQTLLYDVRFAKQKAQSDPETVTGEEPLEKIVVPQDKKRAMPGNAAAALPVEVAEVSNPEEEETF